MLCSYMTKLSTNTTRCLNHTLIYVLFFLFFILCFMCWTWLLNSYTTWLVYPLPNKKRDWLIYLMGVEILSSLSVFPNRIFAARAAIKGNLPSLRLVIKIRWRVESNLYSGTQFTDIEFLCKWYFAYRRSYVEIC